MGAIGGLVGLGGGAAGTSFSGPDGTNIVNPTNPQQLADANTATQGTMAGQQGLLAALQGQGGLGNQSSVFNQMQGTAGQYQNIANGNGPNPALAQLNQTTAQNVAQTGALMAGQRGAGANVGMMARQAGQQGAATQQQAAGQAATLAAQQQLAGLSGLQAQQQNMAGVAAGQVANQVGQTNANTSAAQAQQANLMGAQAGVNSANVGMQSNINSNNAQLANTQMQGQQAMIGGIMNGASSMMSMADGGDVPDAAPSGGGDFGDFKGSSDLGGNASINASVPSFGTDAGAAALGGKSGSGGGGGGGGGGLMSLMALMAGGGEARVYAADGYPNLGVNTNVMPNLGVPQATTAAPAAGPQSSFGKFLKGAAPKKPAADAAVPGVNSGSGALYEGMSKLAGAGVKALKGEKAAPAAEPMQATPMPEGDAAANDESSFPAYAARGGFVGGGGEVKAKNATEKATKSGNNYGNDKIPDNVREHTIIVPRKETMGKNPVKNSAKFVADIIAKRGPGGGDGSGTGKVPVMLSEHEIKIPPEITMGKNPVEDSAKFVAAILAKRRGKS